MERYVFLKWGQNAFNNFRVVPPGTGICHQVNLEYLAQTVWTDTDQHGDEVAYPDTLVGTDSHTTMINGLGIVGWGVGGIEAEAGMLGQPVYFLTPDVVGMELTGKLREGACMRTVKKIGIETRSRPILRGDFGKELSIRHTAGRDIDDAFHPAGAFLEVELAVGHVDREFPQHEVSRNRRTPGHGAALQQ